MGEAADAVLERISQLLTEEESAFGGGGTSASYDGVQLGELDDEEEEQDEVVRNDIAPAAVQDMQSGRGRSVSGVLGARMRRRLHFEKLESSFEPEVKVVEYDVFGTCSLDRAEALNLDPAALEERVINGVKDARAGTEISLNVPILFSYDIVLSTRNPRVYDWHGSARNLLAKQLRGRPTLVALWSSWSEQSIQVIRQFGEWVNATWGGSLLFATVNVDNDQLTMINRLKGLHKQEPEHPSFKYSSDTHFWAGYGLDGDWRHSPAGRAFSLDCIPALVLIDDEGDTVGEAVFLPNDEYDQDAFKICVQDAQKSLAAKINSILVSIPRAPPQKHGDLFFKSMDDQRMWLESLFQRTNHALVVIDQVYEYKQGKPIFLEGKVVTICLAKATSGSSSLAQELRKQGYNVQV